MLPQRRKPQLDCCASRYDSLRNLWFAAVSRYPQQGPMLLHRALLLHESQSRNTKGYQAIDPEPLTADRARFELAEGCPSTVFKTVSLDRSDICPCVRIGPKSYKTNQADNARRSIIQIRHPFRPIRTILGKIVSYRSRSYGNGNHASHLTNSPVECS